MGILRGVLRFVIFLNLSLLLPGMWGCGSAAKSTERIVEGESAGVVEFALQTLDGRTIRPSDYRPQAVLVTYFATWCTPCLDDLPALDSLDRALDDLTVIAVNIDSEPRMLLPSFLEIVPVTFPVVLADAATLDGKSPFGHLAAIPASYLLDGSGNHVQTFLGPTPIDYLHRRVMALAEETR
jgi:thiol-disulfide isomerase/thioredoxin